MKLLFENWRKYLKEDSINELTLPFSSQAKMDKELKQLESEMAGEEHISAWDKIKQEIKETREASSLAMKYFSEGLTEDEKSALWEQIKDIARGTTLAAIFAVPFGSALLPLVLKYTKDVFLPSAFRQGEEQNNDFPYQIYCDMDGVLVDFMSATIEQINKDLKDETITGKKIDKLRQELSNLGRDSIIEQDLDKMDKENRLQAARNYMYRRLEDDEHFWATLPWVSGGKELWSYIGKFNPYILTAPMKGEGSKRGKDIWIQNNLNPPPEKIYMSHEKYNWAVGDDGEPNVLIDDFTTNTIPWEAEGGIAILHTSAEGTITQLEEIKNENLETEVY